MRLELKPPSRTFINNNTLTSLNYKKLAMQKNLISSRKFLDGGTSKGKRRCLGLMARQGNFFSNWDEDCSRIAW